METVVKVGGSLAENPSDLRVLCEELARLSKSFRLLVVPGGGRFADEVRKCDKNFGLSLTTAHQMAVLAMDQFGLLLSNITRNSKATYSLKEAKRLLTCQKLPIFLPSRHVLREDPLEHSWDVTSDSIAAYLGLRLGAEKLILVTDVDGIFPKNPKEDLKARLIDNMTVGELLKTKNRTSVDKFLPILLSKARLDCYVVNGKRPERIEQILRNQETTCTRIVTHIS